MEELTISKAKQILRDNWEQGIECPCCTQLVKLYERKLNSGMAIFLIRLYKLTATNLDFVHASKVLEGTKSLDYSVLKHWGLIQDSNVQIEHKRKSGFWSITNKGTSFVRGEITVPMYVKLFSNELKGFSEKQITIRQALGDDFEYHELMGTPAVVARQEARAVSWLKDED